jgi:prevent-host-death family protein
MSNMDILYISTSVATVVLMQSARSITSSEAKASLGELLGSLATEGPVDITRNGRKVAILSAPAGQWGPVEANRLKELAMLYAAGKVAWREIASETGIAFGDLLVELARQNLRLPRVSPSKRPEQLAMFHGILRHAVRR